MAGSHLAEYLLAEHPDVAVYGTFRWRSRMENLEPLRRADRGVVAMLPGERIRVQDVYTVQKHLGRPE